MPSIAKRLSLQNVPNVWRNGSMEVDKPKLKYHPRTLRDENGNFPIWMNSRAIKRHKAKLKHRRFKRRDINKKRKNKK
ncbi:hypothetical protein TNCV_3225971 [Trichonephila clavipes]|nr:hypothetical protein TNCV_3225971 [Trichonephila clavipes]